MAAERVIVSMDRLRRADRVDEQFMRDFDRAVGGGYVFQVSNGYEYSFVSINPTVKLGDDRLSVHTVRFEDDPRRARYHGSYHIDRPVTEVAKKYTSTSQGDWRGFKSHVYRCETRPFGKDDEMVICHAGVSLKSRVEPGAGCAVGGCHSFHAFEDIFRGVNVDIRVNSCTPERECNSHAKIDVVALRSSFHENEPVEERLRAAAKAFPAAIVVATSSIVEDDAVHVSYVREAVQRVIDKSGARCRVGDVHTHTDFEDFTFVADDKGRYTVNYSATVEYAADVFCETPADHARVMGYIKGDR